jgi:predicted nucleic acid-binding protein
VAFLFDTDAISEISRRRPLSAYLHWLETIPRGEQFTSAVVIGELYKGAYRSTKREFHLEQIEMKVLRVVTVLAYDTAVAKVYGEMDAYLHRLRLPLADADLQIAATAMHHGLDLVTGNVRHFERIPGLSVARVLADARG